MREWVGGWDGAIWDDFSSWTCPFPVADMDWPLSNWGYGLAPFQLGIWTGPFPSPIVPQFAQSDAFHGYNVHLCGHFELGTWGYIQHVCCGAAVFALCVLRPLLLFFIELSIGDRVFYTRSAGLRVPAKVVGLLHDGHVELEYDQRGVRVVNHRCPMDPISFGIPSLESPSPSPSIPAIDVPPEVLLHPLVDGSLVRGRSPTGPS